MSDKKYILTIKPLTEYTNSLDYADQAVVAFDELAGSIMLTILGEEYEGYIEEDITREEMFETVEENLATLNNGNTRICFILGAYENDGDDFGVEILIQEV